MRNLLLLLLIIIGIPSFLFSQVKVKKIIPYQVKKIARVTGKSKMGESLPNPNQTDSKYDIGGTDLGIAWAMKGNQIGLWFGDTYGKKFTSHTCEGAGVTDNWRCNVLAFSHDSNLEDGLFIDHMIINENGQAKELIYGAKDTTGNGDWTSISTAAIRVDGVDYVHVMNIKKWLGTGDWNTNYSAIYSSSDEGYNWHPTGVFFSAESNFSQVCFALKDHFVYMLGTRPGRLYSAYLCRIPEKEIRNKEKYEYWNDGYGWVTNKEELATPIIKDSVGELSLLYHLKYKKWIVTYMSEKDYCIILRSASQIEGPWSKPEILAKGEDFPGLYGAFIHPLKNKGNELYFLMSQWNPYNVFLMKATIKLE